MFALLLVADRRSIDGKGVLVILALLYLWPALVRFGIDVKAYDIDGFVSEYPGLGQPVGSVHQTAGCGEDDRVCEVRFKDSFGVVDIVPHAWAGLGVRPVDVVKLAHDVGQRNGLYRQMRGCGQREAAAGPGGEAVA